MKPNARCLAHLESGGLLLTPDLRSARILRQLHDRAQMAAGREVWHSARVLPLEVWLAQQWSELGTERDDLERTLPAIALHWLWRRQVSRDEPGMLDPWELGALARSSWLRLRAHGADIADVRRYPLTRDQQAFAGWASAAERELRDRGGCDGADLARRMTETGALPAPGPPLLLTGFRRLAPAQSALVSALADRGWSVASVDPETGNGPAWRHAAADPDAERTAMLAWMREQIVSRPDGLHAMIVPDLVQHRGAIERLLEAVLQPELELPGVRPRNRLFDIAGGPSLALQPVAESALDALGLTLGPQDWTATSRLLRSRHLTGAQAEAPGRVRLDLELRAQGVTRISANRLGVRALSAGAPMLAGQLAAATAALGGAARGSAVAWAEKFGACLGAWGWPGDATLDSGSWQAARHFRSLLGELATLEAVAPELDGHQALDELRRLAAQPFQPESGEPGVFVLDAFEDPGVQFDSLWVAGLTAAAWPRPVAVDPLLPIEIQRRLGMPGATPEDCVAEARAIVGRWQARAGALVLSWPRRENDTDVDGSPLIPARAVPLPQPALHGTRERLQAGAAILEPVPDGAVGLRPGAVAPGGARILELQSQCPFRAFAQLRLRAEPLEEPRAGIDRRMRGVVLHRALQRFWEQTGSQQALLGLDAGACGERVAAAIELAMDEALPRETGTRSAALERDWQRRAIDALLALERGRPAFAIAETERVLEGRIGGLELRLRVDRVDRIGDALVVIDYKSGAVASSPWRGARMDSPQLPLYAVLHRERPAGIAIAEVRAGRARFVGVGRDPGVLEGLQQPEDFELTEDRESGFDWGQITEHWRDWLERLAREHAAGHAAVDPKRAADTCRHCHLGALCRVESAAADDGDEADDG